MLGHCRIQIADELVWQRKVENLARVDLGKWGLWNALVKFGCTGVGTYQDYLPAGASCSASEVRNIHLQCKIK